MSTIAHLRKDYMLESLNESDVATDPIQQFTRWWKEAVESEIDEVNAMTLCTVAMNGRPEGRIVLLKDYDEQGFVFFTNYESHKGAELANTPFATLVFFWKELERQVRISGSVVKVPPAESDNYFHSRPLGSRLGALASPQSHPIESREVLESKLQQLEQQYADGQVPRPQHWGGYRVTPDSFEFWQGRPSRLHDRISYTKETGDWAIQRLAP
jgi:pyridoxamine 5'-phosphate oxidase